MNQSTNRIVRCSECGTKNKIPEDKLSALPKCGKCHAKLDPTGRKNDTAENFTLRCTECKTRNRVPADKIDSGPSCGKCGAVLPIKELFKPQPLIVTDSNFDETVLNSPLPVLLFCWAAWCPTCGTVAPIIDEFAAESKGKIRVGKVNIDANRMIASKFNILSVPYLFIFDNGQMKESLPGGLQKHQIMMKMAQFI